jgi:hypothetical protein
MWSKTRSKMTIINYNENIVAFDSDWEDMDFSINNKLQGTNKAMSAIDEKKNNKKEKKQQQYLWIADSGASCHITNDNI